MKNRVFVYACFILSVITLPVLAFRVLTYVESKWSSLPYYRSDYRTASKEDGKKIDPFRFVNQSGNEITEDFLQNKVAIACYFFTRCSSICPKMISGLREIQNEFSKEGRLKIVSFSVDPENDTPEILKQYALSRKIDTLQWNLVTGEKVGLYKYARKSLLLVANDGDGGPMDFIHSDRLVLIDKEGFIRGYYDGTEPGEVKQLKEDIRKVLKF